MLEVCLLFRIKLKFLSKWTKPTVIGATDYYNTNYSFFDWIYFYNVRYYQTVYDKYSQVITKVMSKNFKINSYQKSRK